MGQQLSAAQCCQQENRRNRLAEFQLHVDDLNGGDESQIHDVGYEGVVDPNLVCCRAQDDCAEPISGAGGASMMESLSYVPVRFDVSPTIDVERSHARYSKIVVHSTRARTQRRSKAWEDWLRAATAGRSVTVLLSMPAPGKEKEAEKASEQAATGKLLCDKIPAMYYLDRALTKLSILPADSRSDGGVTGNSSSLITIPVDNIQVICPATDFMLFFDQVDAGLSDAEKARAVLLQYTTEDSERKRVCFVEETETAKERFVQALTALWLEKRNDHSMWF